jgi:hypothetical protein
MNTMKAAMARAIEVEPCSARLLSIVSAPRVLTPACFGPYPEMLQGTPSPDETELNNLNGTSYTSVREIQEIFIIFIGKIDVGWKRPNQSLT